MALAAGTRLGPYQITAQIGVGGMGEVYRARDTKLDRNVAIKVLPDVVAQDAERLARFDREAKTLAALNHPGIAAIYGLEESDGIKALVMELVEGPTLADRIAKGPIPVDEALPIAKQIAEALEAAHEQGIIHRDLKPANVKVRDDGTVKVLDFGLAKAMEPVGVIGSTSASMSPTITTPAMTEMGMILGTAAYMAPEQAKGRAVDRRADIWAFGVVLYEMVTGQRLFEAEDISETLAAVLTRDVSMKSLPPAVPPRLRALLRDCLVRDPKQRLRDVGDARLVLDKLIAGGPDDTVAPAIAAVTVAPTWRRALPAAVALVVGGLAVGLVASALWPVTVPPAVARFPIVLPEDQRFTNSDRSFVAVSPDGTNLVYISNTRLYLRPIAGLDARPIAGSEGVTSGVTSPAFSPDGQSVVYYNANALKRLAIGGGTPITICPATNPYGLTWDESGILFGQAGHGILRVSPNGGTPEVIVAAAPGEQLSNPQMLPSGRAVLFSVTTGTWYQAQVAAQPLDGGARRTLVESGSDGRYLPTGHLVYADQGLLLAIPLDVDTLSVMGGPVPLVEGVRRAMSEIGGAQFGYSTTGTLAFVPGPSTIGPGSGSRDLVMVDRQGSTQPLGLPGGTYRSPRVSPDGAYVTFDTDEANGAEVWIYALAGAASMRRLTFGGRNQHPIWSPDGQFVAFQSDREGAPAIFWQRADGSAVAERLTTSEPGTEHVPQMFSPDGLYLLYSVRRGSEWTLWALNMKDKTASAFDDVSATTLVEAAFSPDGRWIVYRADGETGSQILLQPFPATGAKYLATSGGGHAHWSPRGDQLMLNSGPQRSLIIPVTTTPTVTFGQPIDSPRQGWSEPNPGVVRRNVDWLPDGEYFIGVSPDATTPSATNSSDIVVVLNWFEEVKRLVPTN